jgi:amino acid transporter
VEYLPRMVLAAIIAAIGLALARSAAEGVERTLDEEDFPRARLAGRICKGALVTLVAALTLWELDFARQIVLSGFLIVFGGIAVAFALAVGLGSVEAIRRAWESVGEKRKGG